MNAKFWKYWASLLPKNTTSIVQPIPLGVIHSLTATNMKRLYKYLAERRPIRTHTIRSREYYKNGRGNGYGNNDRKLVQESLTFKNIN